MAKTITAPTDLTGEELERTWMMLGKSTLESDVIPTIERATGRTVKPERVEDFIPGIRKRLDEISN